MTEPLRVLQVVTKMERGGLETFIMNMYRNVDRARVQFDFLCHREGDFAYDDEIKRLGGRIYRVRSISVISERSTGSSRGIHIVSCIPILIA